MFVYLAKTAERSWTDIVEFGFEMFIVGQESLKSWKIWIKKIARKIIIIRNFIFLSLQHCIEIFL